MRFTLSFHRLIDFFLTVAQGLHLVHSFHMKHGNASIKALGFRTTSWVRDCRPIRLLGTKILTYT